MIRRWIGYTVLTLISVSVGFGCCNPPKIDSLNVSLIPQQRDCWCWAATTEMISAYYLHRIDQCDSANYVHGIPPDCCTGCTGNCPCWGWAWGATINEVRDNWTHWGFDYEYVAASLPWEDPQEDDVRDTLSDAQYCGKSPIQAVWWWTGGSGHVVTVYSYAEAGGERYIGYLDPWPPDCASVDNECNPVPGGEDAVMTYDAFVSDAIHTWGNSLYAFEFTGP